MLLFLALNMTKTFVFVTWGIELMTLTLTI